MPGDACSLSVSDDFEIITNSPVSIVSAVNAPPRTMDQQKPATALSPIRSKESEIVSSLSPSESADMLLALLAKHQQSLASIVSPGLGLAEDKFASVTPGRDDASAASEAPARDEGPQVKKHERFFFGDGNVTFLVKDTLYRVHQYFFSRDSPHFLYLISRHAHEEHSSTITLNNVEVHDFDAFLSVLYPSNFKTSDISTVEEWTSVLRLSQKWGFRSIRELAIERLGPISSPVDKIVLGRMFDIAHWLTPGFAGLVERKAPLTPEEGRRLGVEDVILISTLRENARQKDLLISKADIVHQVEERLNPTAASPEEGSSWQPASAVPEEGSSWQPAFAVPKASSMNRRGGR
ncbi:hypothetical protein EW146_g60 [Bondarzewia mesenterica]|uniref:BTB domain-containing protein n=1 Tax=Bondarzewia mesenterica TaxID=1095465 RepID=A0A4S4M9W4_9AGAM|nr:hypothetical protein EW146_g60 [Bondarzewia mesenterica]